MSADDESSGTGEPTVEELREKYADVDAISVDDEGNLHPDTERLSKSGYPVND